MQRNWIFIIALTLSASAAQAQEAELARGAELLLPFKHDLQDALRVGLADGAVRAIDACHVRAPEVASNLSSDGIIVGRASHRLRNPANTSPEWVGPVLDAYLDDSENRAPQVVSLPNDRFGYVEPIVLKPLCLTCHGASLAPAVAARIDELYPDDHAVGYETGDLRGVFWIEFPAEE
jgi:hypothetical protein